VKWRALAVAVVGVSVALASCSFEPEWQRYCSHPGRCSEFDGGIAPSILIAQSSINRRFVLAGDYLADASSVSVIPDTAGTATIASSGEHEVEVDVTVNPGVQIGSPLRLRVLWDQARPDEFQDSSPLEVTAITVATVANGGSDTTGFGTPESPYGSLHHAGQVSGAGDTIHLGAGRFPSIYDAGTTCDHPSGLKPGVSVEGESMAASMVFGDGTADSCAFNLSTGGQTVRGVTITGFTEGIRVTSAGGARPTITDVTISDCDAGVVGRKGSAFQTLRTDLLGNGAGVVCDGCDAVVQQGTIGSSARNGVLLGGDGGRLALTGGTGGLFIQNNAANVGGDDLRGAGVLIASNDGTATVGSTVSGSGTTAVTVAGRSNVVTFDGANLQGSQGDYGLLLKANSDAGVFLKNTTITGSSVGMKVEGAAFVNGGTADGSYGGNTFSCNIRDPLTTELWDARPGTPPQPPMVFSRSNFHGSGVPPAGTDISFDAGSLGIRVDNPANHVRFE